MSGPVTEDEPGRKVKQIEVLMESCNNKTESDKHPSCYTISDESLVIQQESADTEQESQNNFSTKTTHKIFKSDESNEIDSIVRIRLEEYISDSSDSDSSILEDGDMLWIPFSMAQHMGVTIGDCLDTRDRVYANDEELFMSVETSRRSSHLTSLSCPLSAKGGKSIQGHSFVSNLNQKNIVENINNNNCSADDSSELIDSEIQNYDDDWISIKIDR